MNIKYFIMISLFIFACIFYFFKNTQLSKSNNELIIGTAAGYAPFVSINEQGEYEGFDIDIAKAITENMGKKLVIKDLGSMAPLFISLEQGSIDAIIWGLSITQDRLKKVAMIRYEGEATISYPLIFWQKIPAGIRSIQDMKGMTICVEPTSSQDAVLSNYEFITKKPVEKVDDALLNIQYGKADAALVEPAIAQKFKNKFSEIHIMQLQLKPEEQVQGIGIAIKKSNTNLINQIQKAIDELRSEGVIQQSKEKWGII